MNLPGFTAERSLYTTEERYSLTTDTEHSKDGVYPAQISSLEGTVFPRCHLVPKLCRQCPSPDFPNLCFYTFCGFNFVCN
jgi:hypothetical protein